MICRNGWRRVFWEQEASGWVGSNHIVHIRAERLDGAGQPPEQAKGSSQRGLTCPLTEVGGGGFWMMTLVPIVSGAGGSSPKG